MYTAWNYSWKWGRFWMSSRGAFRFYWILYNVFRIFKKISFYSNFFSPSGKVFCSFWINGFIFSSIFWTVLFKKVAKLSQQVSYAISLFNNLKINIFFFLTNFKNILKGKNGKNLNKIQAQNITVLKNAQATLKNNYLIIHRSIKIFSSQ